MKNGVRVEMDQFDLVVDKKVAEEITGWESKSALEEGGEHHDFIGVGCWNVLTSGRAPLQHLTVKEKEARNELADLAFVGDGWMKQVWVWGGMAREEGCGERRKIEKEMVAEEEVMEFPIQSPF
jgi:hypothetical protein